HCKKLKPDWDKLMDEFNGSPGSVVADVDYQGGRDFDSLKKFAEENLGPTCGPANLDLCSAEVKKKVESFMAMSLDRLEGKIRNSIRIVEEEVPIMKKVAAHLKKSKSEL
ncbi:unnamed protein product, partial [Effrenium voratum]